MTALLIAIGIAATLGLGFLLGRPKGSNVIGTVIDIKAQESAAKVETDKAESKASEVSRASSADLAARVRELRARGRAGK